MSSGLLLWHPFCFNRSVLAKDNGASLSTIGLAAAGQIPPGRDVFATTQWSVVLTAQGESLEAAKALEKLCRTYWWPLFGFVRRQGYSPEEAQDITQGFFALFLERRDFDTARREKGRLRSYLLGSLKHFLSNADRRAMTIKRGEGKPLVPLEELLVREGADLSAVALAKEGREPAHSLSADRIYERCWALTLLEQVLARLEEEYRIAGKATLFERLKQMLANEPDRSSQGEIAQELGMTEQAVKQQFYRLRQRCALLLREEIANTVAAPDDVEDELRHFIAVLQG